MKNFTKKLFYNGNIITMTSDSYLGKEYALLIDDKIKKVAKVKDVYPEVDEATEIINLNGKTIMPSFIDSHSHIMGFAVSLGLVNLQDCKSLDALIQKMKDADCKESKWIIGYGYDENKMLDKPFITKETLDMISFSKGVLISHASGHYGIINSFGLKLLGISDLIENPQGGEYAKDGNGTLNGRLVEKAYFDVAKKVPVNSSDILNNLTKAYQIYAENGITTVQEGFTSKKDWLVFEEMANAPLDTICYLDLNEELDFLMIAKKYCQYENDKNIRIGGYKMFLDGTPLELTAWMKEPYEKTNNYGKAIYKDYEVIERMAKVLKIQKSLKPYTHLQLLVHSNGDKACEQYLECLKRLPEDLERPVLIHAQFIDSEELLGLKDTQTIVSFFPSHLYYYGLRHLENFGTRAEFISPLASANELGICYTIHTDTPVMRPNLIEAMHHAINRQTSSGEIFGIGEKISPYEALKAVTINASYQYFEEDLKGTIESGKVADLVILSDNPLRIAPSDFKNIEVLTTIKNGKIIYQKKINVT